MHKGHRYLVDANIFIEAKNRYYGFDICPGFWETMIKLYELGAVASIDQVRQELVGLTDELSDWTKTEMPREFFGRSDGPEVVESYGEIISWVYTNPQFHTHAKNAFADGADGWLIAYARSSGFVIVSHEAPAPLVKRRVPMPNVCEQFGVPYVGPFEMLRELRVRLVCGSH